MKTFDYTITDSLGIHARPAGMLAKEAAKFNSEIKISANGKTADAKRIFGIMGMGIKCGCTITVTADGPDEADAASSLEKFLKENL